MSETIFKAVPGQTAVKLDLDCDLTFVGDGVQKIEIDNITHGSILTLSVFDSLNEIEVKNSGAFIIFKRAPLETIRIRGRVSDVKIYQKNKLHSLFQNNANRTISLEENTNIIVSSEDISEKIDSCSLILVSKDIPEVVINQDYSNILILGDTVMKSVIINGTKTIERLSIENSSSLESLKINKRVRTCSIQRCSKINSITGFGDRLIISGAKKNNLCIGGFWHEVPIWYDEILSMLSIVHFKGHLSSQEIISCEDMGGITIAPITYEGRAGICSFSEEFNWPIDKMNEGIPIPAMVDLIIKNNDSYRVFHAWSTGNLTLFQQYVAMRVLASLSCKGFDIEKIMKTRTTILSNNAMMPKVLNNSVVSGNLGGRWNPMYSGDVDDWETPNNSVIPFGRLDLEIWLNSGISEEEMFREKFQFQGSTNHRNSYGFTRSSAFRSLIVSILSAANSCTRNNAAEEKLTKISEALYTNPYMNTDPFVCEFTIFHINSSRITSKSIIKDLVKGIAEMQTQAWIKAALLIGIVDQTNSSKARVALQRIASDKEFTVEESDLLSRIALEGKNSLENGTFERPTWPYVQHWRKTRRKIF